MRADHAAWGGGRAKGGASWGMVLSLFQRFWGGEPYCLRAWIMEGLLDRRKDDVWVRWDMVEQMGRFAA